jgi:hypothetical protein
MKTTNQLTRFLAMIISIALFFALAFAEELFSQETIPLNTTKDGRRLQSIYLTYGRGVLSSGADMTLDFACNKGRILFLKANNDRALINIGKSFGNFKAILSVGAYKNVPCIAPMFKYKYRFINLTSWNGIAFGKDVELTGPGIAPRFFFSYQTVDITFGKNCVGYALFYRTIYPANHFLFYKRTIPINKNADFTFEATYNYRESIPMFLIGYKHLFL